MSVTDTTRDAGVGAYGIPGLPDRLKPSDQLRIFAGYHGDRLPRAAQDELCQLADEWDDAVDAALASPAAPGAPGGWRMVPEEATETMWQAGMEADANLGDSYSAVWAAMLAAAPEAPTATPVIREAAGGADLEGRCLKFFRQFRQHIFAEDHGAPAGIYRNESIATGSWFAEESKALLQALAARVPTPTAHLGGGEAQTPRNGAEDLPFPTLEIRPVMEAMLQRLERRSPASLSPHGEYGLPSTEIHWMTLAATAITVVRDAVGWRVARPAPAGGAVDREAVARIIQPSGPPGSHLNNGGPSYGEHLTRWNTALAKADRILALAALPDAGGGAWRPIATAPLPFDEYGYSGKVSAGVDVAYSEDDGEDRPLFLIWWTCVGHGESHITHWRPKPAPPTPDTPTAIKAPTDPAPHAAPHAAPAAGAERGEG